MSFLHSIDDDMARIRRWRIAGIIIFVLGALLLLAIFGELPDAEIITP